MKAFINIKKKKKPFALVLSGGGARGYVHVGALKALEDNGLIPSLIVGVSMGALVGTTYAVRDDWYKALLNLDISRYLAGERINLYAKNDSVSLFRFLYYLPRTVWGFFFGWGITTIKRADLLTFFSSLTKGKTLAEGRINCATVATDLRSGDRVVITDTSAAEAIYASAALAGVFAPLQHNEQLLVDGAYADLAPVDVPSDWDISKVITIDASQPLHLPEIKNGFQALMRAVDICHLQHANLRFQKSNLLLRPQFSRPIDTLDFSAKNECVHIGYEMVKKKLAKIQSVIAR